MYAGLCTLNISASHHPISVNVLNIVGFVCPMVGNYLKGISLRITHSNSTLLHCGDNNACVLYYLIILGVFVDMSSQASNPHVRRYLMYHCITWGIMHLSGQLCKKPVDVDTAVALHSLCSNIKRCNNKMSHRCDTKAKTSLFWNSADVSSQPFCGPSATASVYSLSRLFSAGK